MNSRPPGTKSHNPLRGALCLLQGLRLIWKPGLRRYTLIPALINVVLFATLASTAVQQIPELAAAMLPDYLAWMEWILIPLLSLSAILIVFIGVLLLANLVAAPFNAILAEKVEQQLSGNTQPDSVSMAEFLRLWPRVVWSEVRKIGYFLLRAIPLLILFLIPGLNLVAPVLWFLFSAWFLALEYADYPMGNHGLDFRQQLAVLRNNRLPSLGFGSMAFLLVMIPGLNFIAIPACVAGASALWVSTWKETA